MSRSSDDVKAPCEWIKWWGIGDELISDENYGKQEMSGIKDPKMPTMGRQVAHAAVFLASDETGCINGVVLPVDAGLLCRQG